MHFYEINPCDRLPFHVVARTPHEAASLFMTWSAARGRIDEGFTVDRLPVEKLKPEQQEQVRNAMAAGLIGVSHYDEDIGWTFSPPLWVPLGSDELPDGGNVGGQS